MFCDQQSIQLNAAKLLPSVFKRSAELSDNDFRYPLTQIS